MKEIRNPTVEELKALNRDLLFRPVENPGRQFLRNEQIDDFNRDGYLLPFDGLSPEEIDDLRSYFDRILDMVLSRGDSSYSISTAHLKYRRIYELMSHPSILAPVRDLLGDNLIGWGAHFFCKMPMDGKKVPWHQDCLYWPLSPSRTVTVWLAIDDASLENACMQFIPGSHRLGPMDFTVSTDPSDILNLSIRREAVSERDSVPVELRAGQFSIHSDLLLHGSDENRSDRRRCGLTMRYAAAEVRATHGWHHKGIIVSGNDSSGHWANPEPPEE